MSKTNALRRLKKALDNKYETQQMTPTAGAVGDGKLFIGGQLYDGALSGIAQVVNTGRPAAAQYAAKAGGQVIVRSSGGGGTTTGGSSTDVTALSLLTVVAESALTNDRYLDVSSALTKTDGGAGAALTLGLNTPGTLTVSSTNVATGNHTHAITSSSAPGAAASLLASSSAGNLTLPTFTATTKLTTPLIDTASGDLTLQPAGTSVVDINALLTGGFGARATSGTLDWNDVTNARPGSGHSLLMGSATNGPSSAGGRYFHPFSFEYSTKTGGGNLTQLAIPYANSTGIDGGIHMRGRFSGAWTNWVKVISENTSGNVLVGTYTDGGYKFDVTGTARITTSLTTPIITTTGAGVDLTLSPTDDIVLTPGSNIVKLSSSKVFQSDNYASQLTGMRITHDGQGDFRYLYTDEMHAKSFIADLEQALAGGQIIAKSVTLLYLNFTAPAASASTTITVRDLPSATGMACFQNGDYIRVRNFSRAGGGLDITDCWGTVTLDTSYGVSGFDSSTKSQRYTFTRSASPNAGAMSSGTVVYADAIILDYGTSGNGFYEVNAIDGLNAINSPYAQIVTWSGHPRTQTLRARLGNLYGIFAQANEYGLFAGNGTADTDPYLRISSNSVRLNNVPLRLHNSGVQTVNIDSAGTDIWVGPTSADKRLYWNGTTLNVVGQITITGGSGISNFSDANLDNIANGSTYFRTTANQVTGAGRAYTALNSSNNLVTSVIPASAITPSGAGLYLGSNYMGYYDNSSWKTYIDSSGNMKLLGNASNNYIQWAAASNKLQGVGGGTEQWYADATDGKLYAGAGAVWLDANGTNFNVQAAGATPSYLRFASGATLRGGIGFIYTAGPTPDPTDGMVFYNASSTKFRFAGADSTEFSSTVNVTGSVTATVGMSVGGTAVSLNGHTHSYLPLSGGTLTGTLTSRAITPSADNTYDLGASGARWQDIYAVNLHVDTIVGTPSYSHSHAASDITSGTLDFARIPTTWTGALTLDADSAGTTNYIRWLTQTSTSKAWDLVGRSHDYATAAQQNDLLLTYYDGATIYTAFHADSATRVIDFGQTPTVGGTAVVLASRTVSAGSAMTGGGALSANITISHADTSTQASVNNSGMTFVQDVTLDDYGHVTALTSTDVSSVLTGYVKTDGTTTGATSQAQAFTNGIQSGFGTTAAPSLSFVGDTDTGIIRSAANKIGLVTNATEWATLDSVGLLTVNKVLAAGWVKNSLIGIAGEGPNDLGMLGLYDRNELINADLRGAVTISITGAGSVTTSSINNAFNARGSFLTITGTDNTTTQILIHIDLGANQSNYSSALWQPFLQYRLSMNASFTHYRTIVCEVSTDNSAWYKPAGGEWETTTPHTDEIVPGLWMGDRGNPSTPGNVYRYVRFTLTDRFENAGYASKAFVWISQIGLRHYSAPYSRAWMYTSGDTMYGALVVKTSNAAAFDVQNASGTSILKANTSATTVYITGDLDVSDNVMLASGSASLPALAGSADTNTGIYWSAADTLAITTGGTQRATVDSVGFNLVSGKINATAIDQSHILDTALVGTIPGASNWAGFAHKNHGTLTGFSLIHTSSGETLLNGATTASHYIGGAEVWQTNGFGLQSPAYASQATGWRISSPSGSADFRYIYTDEMHAKAFIADLEQALAGGQIIAKSVTLLHADFRTPYFGGSQRITVKDLPSAPGMQVFEANDYIALRSFARASGELLIGYAWGTVTDPTDNTDGTQTWTFNRSGTSTYSTITQRGTATSAATAAGTSVAPTKPTGVTTDDVLVAIVTHDGAADTITATNWELLGTASGTDINAAIYYKVADAGEPASYTFSTASSHALAASIVAYYNVDTTYTPIDSYSIQANAAGASMTAPVVWTSSTAGELVFLGGVSNNTSSTAPSGMTEIIDAGATGIRVYAAKQTLAASGTAGPKTATIASSSYASIGALIMLRPKITVFYDAEGGGIVPGTVVSKDAIIVDYGTTGSGYYEVNAADGLNAENSPYSQIVTWATHPGPAGNRSIRSRWGNLNGLSIADYGLLMGSNVSSSTTRTFDFRASTGNLTLGANGGAIVLEGDGDSYFSGVMTIGTSGGIYQGSGTFASPTTGLKIWNDTGTGRIGGYNSGTVQWYANTDGKLYAGAGNALLDSNGISVIGTGVFRIMENSSTIKGYIYSSNPLDSLILNNTGVGIKTNGTAVTEGISLRANTTSGNTAELAINAASSGGVITALVYPNGTSTAGQMQLSNTSFTLKLNGTSTTDFSVDGSGNVVIGGDLDMSSNDISAVRSVSIAPPAGVVGATVTTPTNQTIAGVNLTAANCGSSYGPYINISHNNNGSTPSAGHITINNKNGTYYSIWPDGSGNLRIVSSAQPTNATDLGGVVCGTQTSYAALKTNVEPWDGDGALGAVMALPLHSYRFKADESRREYHGIVINDNDRGAWFSDNDASNQTPVLNERNLFGYLIAAIKAQQAQIEELKKRLC